MGAGLQVTATSVATLVGVSWGVAVLRTGVSLGSRVKVGEGVPLAGTVAVGVNAKARPIPVQPANKMMIAGIVTNKRLPVIICLQTNKF
jgi:hypothetical protein